LAAAGFPLPQPPRCGIHKLLTTSKPRLRKWFLLTNPREVSAADREGRDGKPLAAFCVDPWRSPVGGRRRRWRGYLTVLGPLIHAPSRRAMIAICAIEALQARRRGVASGEGRQREDIPTGGAGRRPARRFSAVSLGSTFPKFLLIGRLPRSASTDNSSGKSKQVIETAGAPGRVRTANPRFRSLSC
jgi:hypothetical protein